MLLRSALTPAMRNALTRKLAYIAPLPWARLRMSIPVLTASSTLRLIPLLTRKGGWKGAKRHPVQKYLTAVRLLLARGLRATDIASRVRDAKAEAGVATGGEDTVEGRVWPVYCPTF